MRIIYIDIDTLRADHLGCYGYHRNTSPNIDSVAKDGIVFENYYTSDAPCLPSRTALFSGQFGINTGVTNHGKIASQLFIDKDRGFRHRFETDSLFGMLRYNGFYTAGITPFASRHSAWFFYCGFNEIHDTGKFGIESAEEVLPVAEKWLNENSEKDNWYLHVNFWDPHTPYRAPEEINNPFEKDDIPKWITQEIFDKHFKMAGPHCAQEIGMYTDYVDNVKYPRQPGRLDNLSDVKRLFDGYDTGIYYSDTAVGKIIDILKKNKIYEDTAIIISSDHGENMGELGIYAEHGTADNHTCRIPMIIKWPGGQKNIKNNGLHYNVDLVPTLAEIINSKRKSSFWDGMSYAKTIFDGEDNSHKELIISQMSHVVQRSVRYDKYLYMRTYHDGFHFFPKHMLFDVEKDPHLTNDIAEEDIETKTLCESKLFEWVDKQMSKKPLKQDPLWTVLNEGGPFHANGTLKNYCETHLVKTNRQEYIEEYKKVHPKEFK